ncbi:MAG TPA: universal stress protein [Enhygromyxa sp.]|nr:universal stress protein [Enhygromyxa sp.]
MVQPDQARAKTWGVGVELAEDHLGPVRFAATLTQLRPDDREIGIHVIPDQQLLHPLVTPEEADESRELAVRHVTEVMAREGLTGERVRVELAEDDEIERGLSEAAIRLGVDALIIGRRARRDEDPVVRLGPVTRRILRRLPAPVIVVPPDYGDRSDGGLGEGPVILGVELEEHDAAAAKFAVELAARLDRELLLAHGTSAYHWGVSYMPTATMEKIEQHARDAAAVALQQWAAEHELGGARQRVFVGDPVKQLLELANSEDAAVLVTGSRMLGPVERLFLASVSSELAAGSRCPVAVVPSR